MPESVALNAECACYLELSKDQLFVLVRGKRALRVKRRSMGDKMLQVIKNTYKRYFSYPSPPPSAQSSIRNSASIIPILTESHKVPVDMLGALFLVPGLCVRK